MKNTIYAFLFLTTGFLLGNNIQVKASHAAGAELRYDWVSGATYKFTYTFYRSCEPGAISEPTTVQLAYYATCGGSVYCVTMPKAGGINGVEVSPGCPGFPTYCSGGTIPGYQEWKYTATVTLPSQCNFWRFYVSVSARNQAINNLANPSSTAIYVEATLNNLAAQGNSSPYFTVKPINYMCVNSPYTFNNGAVDPNGDSLSYELIQPNDGGGTCTYGTTGIPIAFNTTSGITYNLTNNPISTGNTFVFNQSTGAMNFTPNMVQIAVLTTKVLEWRNGQVIGTCMRDMQYVVLNCTSTPPALNTDTTTLTGVQMINGQVQGCAGQPFNFCFHITSANSSAVLVANANNGAVASGSAIAWTGMASSNIQGCFTWNPTIADTGLVTLSVTVKDSTCTPPGILLSQTFSIPLYVWGPTIAGPDTSICSTDSLHLWAHGGLSFSWSVLPGGSPISTLSCTNCQYPTATPSVTTKYVVTSMSGNTLCFVHKDTVTVNVLPPPNFNLGPDVTTCIGDSMQLNIHLIPNGNTVYTINWSPSIYLSNDTIAKPWVKPLHDTTYIVTVIPGGLGLCGGSDTQTVHVLQGFTIFNSDTAICKGQTVQINALGSTQYNYTWTPSIGVNNTHIINPGITPDTSRFYSVVAKYPGCTDSVHTLFIDVQPNPTVYAGADRVLCMGDTVHLNPIITPAQYPFYSYTWTPAGGLSNQNTPKPVFTGLVTTNLVLTVKTPKGCNGNDAVKFTVVNASFMQLSSDTAICPRDTAHLKANGGSITSIAWSPNIYLYNSGTKTPTAFPVTTTTYTVIAKDTNNCQDTAYLTVEVKPEASITLPDSARIYPGDSYQIEPQGNCLYFQWFPPLGLSATNISNPIASPNVNTRYFVQGVTEFGCSVVDSMDVMVSYDSYIDVPNAFTPGGGADGEIKVIHLGNATLKSFIIYNRWGQKVFEGTDIATGWDGNFNGKPQPMGVYVYSVEAVSPTGRRFTKQGNITLIR